MSLENCARALRKTPRAPIAVRHRDAGRRLALCLPRGPYVSAWSVNGTSVTWPLSVTIPGTSTSQATDLRALTPGRIDGRVCGPSQYTFFLLNGNGLTVAQASNQQTNCAAWSYQDYNQGLFRACIDVPSGGALLVPASSWLVAYT